ncbi:hypothetical protein OSB04_016636 [Centaurea solstitialis]|uniref:RPW8 domain-containing protein n=1 Tax=Centaurea solstitialis TaxID=347529 RepID=A0AA38WL96_9ASTR|nr:hypothetical protein OSB04_016636 [Centaurea solstitialis]
MAGLAEGALAGAAVSKSSDGIIHVIKKLWQFRTKLNQTEETTKKIKPFFTEIEQQNEALNLRTEEREMYANQLKEAEDLVEKCKKIKWYSYKRYPYSLKLDDLDEKLTRFLRTYVPLQAVRNGNETLMIVRDLKKEKEIWRRSCSAGVPLLDGDVIGFDDRVRALKAMVLKDSKVDDCSVVVVSAAGGYGKTTLVTKLCHDPDIEGTNKVTTTHNDFVDDLEIHMDEEKFGRNIYFVTISETPKIKVVVQNLLQKNQGGQQPDFVSDEDATRQWGSFLRGNTSPLLLVLDDVWDANIVTKFKFKSKTYKILVTSRSTLKQFNTYKLKLLKDQNAMKLFRHSAFPGDGSIEGIDISDALVDEMVKHCKNHPLVLSVVGGLLKGKGVSSWDHMLKRLSEGTQSVLDLDKSIPLCLERSLDALENEPAIKQCYMDLGLFPEDQKIAATTLMDMWVHLYKHDDKGLETINQLTELSSKNLATQLQISEDESQPQIFGYGGRDHGGLMLFMGGWRLLKEGTWKPLPVIANYCEEEFVVQHDMMRRLAIKLSSKEPVERLIIEAAEQMPPQMPHTVNSRILSISTGMFASFPFSKDANSSERLKILIITNYGYYFSQLQNFPAPQYLSGLTRIRLEHVSISSISTSLLELANLQKLSLIMCKIGNSFNECSMANKFPSLLEIEMESCEDLVTFPAMFCNLPCLKSLVITNCLELSSLPNELGNLTNLEVLRLASCSKLTTLPESVIELQNLRIIDLNHCLQLAVLPAQIGELGRLQTILMIGCTGLNELPSSIKDPCSWKVVCDEEIFQKLWSHLQNVEVTLVEEDRFDTFMKIVAPRT